MAIEDFIPHRLLINHALRKASDDLKTYISEYQTQYEQKMAEYKAEVDKEIERKNQLFERIKQSYIDQLTIEGAALKEITEIFFKYVDVYRKHQVLKYQMDIINKELALLTEYRGFLVEQIKLIDTDIKILNERENILARQSAIDDIIALIQLSSSSIECTPEDNAKSLLDKVNYIINNKDTYETTRSLLRLRALLHERAEFLPVIKYISWLKQQKKDLIRELKNKKSQILSERTSLFTARDDLKSQINETKELLQSYANEVRNIWANPLADLLIKRARVESELTEAYSQKNYAIEALNEMRYESSNDSERWERLQEAKRNSQKNIPTLRAQKKSIKTQIKPWKDTQKEIIKICKNNNIYLDRPRDGFSDEVRILLGKKEESLSQIEALSTACEQEKEKKQAFYRISLSETETQIEKLKTQETTIKQRLKKAQKDIDDAEKRDSRSLFARILSDSDEVVKAKEKKAAITREMIRVQANLVNKQSEKNRYNSDLERIITEIDQEYSQKISDIRSEIYSIDLAIEYDKDRKYRRMKVAENESEV